MALTKITNSAIADDIGLGGNPTTSTQTAGNSTTRIATTAFVSTAVANLVDSAPATLNTLNELAAAIGDNATFSSTMTTSIASKLPLAGGTLTGGLTGTTGTFSGALSSGAITSSGDVSAIETGHAKVLSNSVGDYFPSINISRTSASTKLDYEWEFQVGSSGFLNFKDQTNSYYPIILKSNGDVALANNTSGASPVLLLDQSAASATFAGNIAVTGTVDGIDIAARDAILTSTTTTAGAALPKAGGTMTGALTVGVGQILASAGSASAPSISFAGDTNTGIYSGAADNIYVAIGGALKGFWSASQFNVTGNGIFSGNGTFGGTLGVTGAATFGYATFTPSSGENVVITRDSAGPYIGTSSNHSLRIITNNGTAIAISTANQVKLPNGGSLNFDAASNGNFDIAYKSSDNTFNIINNSSSAAMGFHTNSTERMRITSTGNVGIGTTSPEGQLTLQNDDAYLRIRSNTTTTKGLTLRYNHAGNFGQLLVDHQGNNQLAMKYYALTHTFGRSDSDKMMTIDSNGKVGIGTTSPNAVLSLIDPDLTATGTGLGGLRVHRPNAASQYGYFDYSYNGGGVNIGSLYTGGNAASFGTFTFRQHSNGATQIPMFIDSVGKVGIGTTTPQHELVIHNASNPTLGIVGSGYNDLIAIRFGGGDLTGALGNGNSGAAILSQQAVVGGQAKGDLQFQINTGDSLSTAMFIKTDGKVGIGTSNPNLKLHVEEDTDTWVGEFKNTRSAGGYGLRIDNSGAGSATDTRYALGVYTPGNSGFFVRNNGKVGIGTTAPTKQLTISGADAEFLLSRTGGYADTINMGMPSGVPTIVGGTDLAFGGSGAWTEHMRIKSDGKVGIGTTTPQETLVVSGDTDVTGQMYLGPNDGSRRPFAKFSTWGYSVGYKAIVLGSTSATYGTAISGSTTLSFNYDPSGNSNGSFSGDGREILFRNGTQFATPNAANNAFNLTNLVLKDGNVGIGVVSPNNKLEVNGHIGFSKNGTNGNRYLLIEGADATYAGTMNIQAGFGSTAAGGGVKLYAHAHATYPGSTWIGRSAGAAGDIMFGNGGTGPSSASQIQMVITSAGQVGIGETSPGSALEVNDSTNYKGIHIRGNAAPCLTFGQNTSSVAEWKLGISGFDGNAFSIGTGTGANDRFTIKDNGNVGIGTSTVPDMHATGVTVAIPGAILSGYSSGSSSNGPRNTRDWFVYSGPSTNSGNYVHMKTDLWGGGGGTGNTEYTMSCFNYHSYYAYGGSTTPGGYIGWHNWSNSFPNVQLINNGTLQLVQSSYISSDGYVVLVALVGSGYAQFSIDWHQWAGYPFRTSKVTASSMSTSATGAY